MKKIFLMSLGIIASYTSMQGMDPDVTTITINGKQGKIPMGSIRRHAPGLAERIEARGNPTDPVTIPGYPDEKFTMYLKPLLCILKAAAEILQPDPSSEEGSYKELQRKMFANKLHAGHTLELMQLGHEKLQLDPNIISAFSLNIACSPEVKKILENLLDQQKEDLRKNIILQYFLEHNHTMPETGRDEDNPQFTLTDVLIHAKLATRDLPRWLSHWDED